MLKTIQIPNRASTPPGEIKLLEWMIAVQFHQIKITRNLLGPSCLVQIIV